MTGCQAPLHDPLHPPCSTAPQALQVLRQYKSNFGNSPYFKAPMTGCQAPLHDPLHPPCSTAPQALPGFVPLSSSKPPALRLHSLLIGLLSQPSQQQSTIQNRTKLPSMDRYPSVTLWNRQRGRRASRLVGKDQEG
jgi:hypothetical protein